MPGVTRERGGGGTSPHKLRLPKFSLCVCQRARSDNLFPPQLSQPLETSSVAAVVEPSTQL